MKRREERGKRRGRERRDGEGRGRRGGGEKEERGRRGEGEEERGGGKSVSKIVMCTLQFRSCSTVSGGVQQSAEGETILYHHDYDHQCTAHHKLNYWQTLVNLEVGLLENTGGSVRATFSRNTTPFSRLLCGMSLHMGLGRAREESVIAVGTST